MSGIYIPGLRVPEENEDELWIAVRSDGTVTFNAEWGWTTNKGKAVSVPPHGRCVDADALIQNSKINTFEAVFAIAEAKTILPAEEQFGKSEQLGKEEK